MNIGPHVIIKLRPFGKSYKEGSWGREAKQGNEEPVTASSATQKQSMSGNIMRTYSSFSDFMSSKNYQDVFVASSYTSSNAIQGPGTVLYGGAF